MNFKERPGNLLCPNCDSRLPASLPRACPDCGFTIEVFRSREDAARAAKKIEAREDTITTSPLCALPWGWILGHTRMLLG